MQIEMALVLHVAAWQVGNLSKQGFIVSAAKLEGIKFRFKVCLKEGVPNGVCRWGLVENFHDGHQGNAVQSFLKRHVLFNLKLGVFLVR